jgi:hypothetical protein
MGSGTTAVAALRLRRAAVTIEQESTWIQLALIRIVGKLICVVARAAGFQSSLDLRAVFMDRSIGEAPSVQMALTSTLVHRERKYFFVGAHRREVVYSVVADSLEEAWKHFQSSPHQTEQILSVIKTETEIYLAL